MSKGDLASSATSKRKRGTFDELEKAAWVGGASVLVLAGVGGLVWYLVKGRAGANASVDSSGGGSDSSSSSSSSSASASASASESADPTDSGEAAASGRNLAWVIIPIGSFALFAGIFTFVVVEYRRNRKKLQNKQQQQQQQRKAQKEVKGGPANQPEGDHTKEQSSALVMFEDWFPNNAAVKERYTVRHNRGGGDCQFLAVSQALDDANRRRKTGETLRKLAAAKVGETYKDPMLAWPLWTIVKDTDDKADGQQLGLSYGLFEKIKQITGKAEDAVEMDTDALSKVLYDHYAQKGAYGDQTTLQALADILRTDIRLVSQNRDGSYAGSWIRVQEHLRSKRKEPHKPITLLLDLEHYEMMTPK